MACRSLIFSVALITMTVVSCAGDTDPSGMQNDDDSKSSVSQTKSDIDEDDNNDMSGSADDDDDGDTGDDDDGDTGDDDDDNTDDNDDDETTESSSDESSEAGSTDGDDDDDDSDTDDPDDRELAEGLTLTGIEVNQAVAIRIAEDRKVVPVGSRRAPLVRDRHALVRAIYDLESGWTPRELEGRLTLHHKSGDVEVVRSTMKVEEKSDLSKFDGTIEWKLEPEQMSGDLEYSVGIFETSAFASSGSNDVIRGANSARFPETGTEAMGVPDKLMRIEVMVVKISVNGQMPVFDDANLETLKKTIYEQYPIAEAEITFRDEPVTSASCGSDNGATCLKEVEKIRAADAPAPHVYYMGLGSEASVGGISNVAPPNMNSAARRASFAFVGTGAWEGALAVRIVGHELGHANNHRHTPGCNAAGAVTDYPYLDSMNRSMIGVQGYQVLEHVLHDSETTFDIMCYCQPKLRTSEYTYQNWSEVVEVLSSWPQYREDTNETGKVDILRGFVKPGENKGDWWIVRDHMPTLPKTNKVESKVATRDGQLMNLPVYIAEMADTDVESFYIALPSDTGDLATIDLNIHGDPQRFDRPLRLRADFDRIAGYSSPLEQ